MANECESVSIKYKGNGSQVLYTFPFTYMDYKDIVVFLYDEAYKKWENQAAKFVFANATTVEFLIAPPAPTDSTLENIWITRRTDLETMLATFYPGSSVRAQDLNDDFDQLRLAIQESRCSIDELQSALNPDVITRSDQESGFWQASGDQELLATSGAIAARHDAYVRDAVPLSVPVQQTGKTWQNTDDCWSSYWNPDAKRWVAYVNTGPRGVQGVQGPPGPIGPPGEGINVIGSVPNFSDLPTLTADDLEFWYVETENTLYFWNGARWDNAGAPGGTGPQGDAATIQVGNTTNGAPGTAAQVTNSGNSSAAIFDFVIPEGQKGDPGADGADGATGEKGDKGDTGTAATVAVGDTTTGAPGSNAAVTNTGTPQAAVLNFTIPRGEKGEKGDAGIGIQYKGSWDQASTAPPSPVTGDLYAWTGATNTTLTNANWGSLNGTEIDYGDRIAYTEDSDWSIIPAPDTTGVVEVTSDAPVTVNNSNPARPVIGFNQSGFIKNGSNVSLLSNDAGYITLAEVPPGGVTSVNSKTGDVVLNSTDVGAAPSSHVGSTGTGAHGLVTTSTAGFMSSGDKTKLNGIQVGAQVNVATNLGSTRNTNSVTVTSSTGSSTTINAATVSDAGVMTTTQVNKLNGIASGAQPGTVTSVSTTAPIVTNGSSTAVALSFNISLLQDLP